MSEKICIIGAGVSGLVCAHILSRKYDVQVFESNDYAGGHTNTEDVSRADGDYKVNTGFIVFNRENYPNFLKLINALGVEYQESSMSFSVKCQRTGLEYGFENLDAVFAQRKNLFSFPFLKMLYEIFKFRKEFDKLLKDPASETATVGAYMTAHGYSKMFLDQFLIPFGAAIWSTDYAGMSEFPLKTFIQFFKNHGFLADSELLQWYTLKGGSRSYVTELLKKLAGRIHLDSPVESVKRVSDGVEVSGKGFSGKFDKVIIAAHSDQALAILNEPTQAEKEVLGAIGYQANDVVLHVDRKLLPEHRQTWSSWNYLVPYDESDRCTVTYDMNILQHIKSKEEFLVTLNQSKNIEPGSVIKDFVYHHPVYTNDAVAAQARYSEINGIDRIFYAGAYWGYGFHEDGVNSALAACAGIDPSLKL